MEIVLCHVLANFRIMVLGDLSDFERSRVLLQILLYMDMKFAVRFLKRGSSLTMSTVATEVSAIASVTSADVELTFWPSLDASVPARFEISLNMPLLLVEIECSCIRWCDTDGDRCTMQSSC